MVSLVIGYRKSVAGYAVYLGLNLVFGSLKKQHVVSRSSTETKCKGLALATAEVLWIRVLLTKMQIKTAATAIMWCDNLGAIVLATNPVIMLRLNTLRLIYIQFEKKIKLNKF